MENDIALLGLALSSAQATVGLIDTADTSAQPDDGATIVGWGHPGEGGQVSYALQEVTIPIVSNEPCQDGYAAEGITIAPTMLCAGLEPGQKESCQGTSGGPLVVRAGYAEPWQQAGIVSFGFGCARPGKFGVYTRVSQYREWIEA